MLSLIQRVTRASVTVDGQTVGAIGPGLLALVGLEPGDGEAQIQRMAQRLLGYRVFADDAGRMNRSLTDTGGGLLLVSQFTLAADTASGMRPSFTTAAPPEEAERGFNRLVEVCRARHGGGGNRAFRRPYGGGPGQRRPGDFPAAALSCCKCVKTRKRQISRPRDMGARRRGDLAGELFAARRGIIRGSPDLSF